MIAFNYRPTNTGSRKFYYLQQISVFTELLETISCAVSNQQFVFVIARIETYAVCIIEMSIPFSPAAKMIFQLALIVVLQYVLSPVAIGNKNIAVTVIDDSFSRNNFLRFRIDS